MRQERGGRGTWFDALTKRFILTIDEEESRELERGAEAAARNFLVVKTRWVLLLLITLYGICAGGFFYFSRYGFFLSRLQMAILVVSLIAVISYNTVFERFYPKFGRFAFVNHAQIFLDILFVTILIQFSGGAASWFWPVYLIVTIEATYLLERKRDIWLVEICSLALFGALLAGHYYSLLPSVDMPFVDVRLHHDPLFLILIWCWVAILNITVAMIGGFLVSVIRQDNEALRRGEEQLISFLDTANDFIFSVAPDGRFLYLNRTSQDELGYSQDEVTALTLDDVIEGDSKAACLREFHQAMAGERANPVEIQLNARDGRTIAVEGTISCSFKDDSPAAIWVICRDVTERKETQAQLYHMAHHDILTGLPNRFLLIDRLKQAKALAQRLKQHIAVLFFDLDRFKIINDTLGHHVGDKLLQEVARRIIGCVREVDTVARIGGDEFTVVLVNISDPLDAEMVAVKIQKSLAYPFAIDEHELYVTASIGISVFPRDGDDPASLIKKADIAMYHAKGQGRNNHQFYDKRMDVNAENRLALAIGMRKALDREEFRVYYQPKIDILSGKITAMEALLRWEHPEFGLLLPADFIPLAEETGLILPIGEWVLQESCRQNRAWQDQGLPRIRVAVNLSGYQLQQNNFTETVKNALDQTGLAAEFLELEITETIIMQNPDFVVAVLSEFRDLGVHISIDDFGTGYSSLAHLKRFSVNTLKIDKSFVRDVEINATDAAIATAIISMGNSMNLRITAEGVETEGQLLFLKEKFCDEVQGYLYSRPLPPEDVIGFLRNGIQPGVAKGDAGGTSD